MFRAPVAADVAAAQGEIIELTRRGNNLANVTRPDDDSVAIRPVQLSAQAPFVALDDIEDLPKLREITTGLATYLEDEQFAGV